jgi:hypothetical protein
MNLFLSAKKLSLFLILMVSVFSFCTGQTILADDFNRADNNTVGNGWTEIETAATGARIVSNRLQLGSTTAGREFVWQDLSSFASPIITNGITNNTSLLTWAFNFRTSNSNTSGFDASNYGMAFILCKTTTPTNTGNGYAVVIGQSGTTDPVRLVSFTGGGDLNSEYTNIISGGDYGTEYISVRVTYDPATDQWSLFAESNASAFPQADPRNTATQIGSTTVNTTYTAAGNDLRYFGAYWNHSTGASDNAIFDDIYAPVTTVICTPTATVSNFSPSQGPAGTIVTITGTGLNTVTQVLFGGVAATTFSFISSNNTIIAEVPASALTGKVTLVDGASCSSQSTGDFTVLSANSNCGSGATGTDLIISEVFDSRTGSLSYIEIFNPTASSINLNNYFIRIVTDGPTNTDMPTLSGSLASGAVGIIRIGDPTTSGSSVCTGLSFIQTNDAAGGFNGNDRVILRRISPASDLDVVDNPNYGGANPSSGSNVRGFSQLRNPGNVTPRSTYVASEWNNADPETCSHLGTAPAAVTTTNVTITSHPADVGCATVTFSVTASTTTGPIQYNWYYQVPGSSAWLQANATLNGTSAVTAAGFNTASITITGNTAILKDYQFYCEIRSDGGASPCIKYSNAAQYNYSSLPYYETIGSGNWNDPAIWRMSNTEVGGYTTACQYPVAANSIKVNIRNGHTVTQNLTVLDIDWININTGGALAISNTSLINFNNGNSGGADLEVNGTLTDGGSSGNGVSFNTGSTWQLGSSATLIKTNTSSAVVYRDNYEAGMSTIPATANWIVRASSVQDVTFTTVGGTFYPNLTFESTSGNSNPTSGFSRFTGNTSFATVKGNLDIGGATQPGTVTVYNENTNATPLQILGNLTVRAGSTLTNNNGVAISGTGFEVRGNVSVAGTITVTGFTGTNGVLVLSGTNPQTVSGAGAINLQDVTINNSSIGAGGGVTLNRALGMNGNLTLSNGLVNTTSTFILALSANATNTGGGSAASFINGPMRKAGTAAFTFPVGTNTPGTNHYRTITISSGADNTYTAQFHRADSYTQGTISNAARLAGLQRISRCEYWDLIRAGAGYDRAVTITWNNQSPCEPTVPYIVNTSGIVVVQYNGTQWGDTFGGTATCTVCPTTAGTVTWTSGPSLYNKFVLGSNTTELNPLPFELTIFNATAKNGNVFLDWTTNTNEQAFNYTIERSSDGIGFETLLSRTPTLQQTIASYEDTDATPLNGWNFYRLRTTGLNGKTYVSNIRKVWMGTKQNIILSPVPVRDVLTVTIAQPESVLEIQLLNSAGQVLQTQTRIRTRNDLNLSQLAKGMYYIRLIGKENISVKSFVK